MIHRRLSQQELNFLIDKVHKEQHLLYYTYLTVRQNQTIHYGQFNHNGELLGVVAYLKGLPFHAFSYYLINDSIKIQPLLSYIKSELNLPNHSIGNTLVPETDQSFFSAQIELIQPIKELFLMKHKDPSLLPPVDPRVIKLNSTHSHLIQVRMNELNAIAFTEDELHLPFYGVIQDENLIAVGGYHLFDHDYVEVGNIGTVEEMRRKGWGKRISTELTRHARKHSDNVYLYVQSNNIPAIRLYKSIGYQVVFKCQMAEFYI